MFPVPICKVELPDDVMVKLELETNEILHEKKEDHADQLAGKIYEGEQIAVPRKGFMKMFIDTGIIAACEGYVKGEYDSGWTGNKDVEGF